MIEAINKYTTFKDAYSYWTTNFIRDRSYNYICSALGLNKKIDNEIFSKCICDVNVKDVNKIIEDLTNSGLSVESCYGYYKVLKGFFNYLINNSFIEKNPVETSYGLPSKRKINQSTILLLSQNEMKVIISKLESTDIANLSKISLYSGQKIDDLINMQWNNVDFDNHKISINQRVVEVDETVIKFFLDELNKQYQIKKDNPHWRNHLNHIFTDKNGNKLLGPYVKNIIEKAGKEIGIINLRQRCFVDYYIVLALRNGISYKTILDQLGRHDMKLIKTYLKIANIDPTISDNGEDICLTDTLYERYIKSHE